MPDYLIAGKQFPWEYISGAFLRLKSPTEECRSILPFAEVVGDKVVGRAQMGAYALTFFELPNPDVEPDERIINLPIENKSDFKSMYRAHLDTGVKEGSNEIVIVYEHRRGLLGRKKPCLHVAAFPKGTWDGFFDAVANYESEKFEWPDALFLYQPSGTKVFNARINLFEA